MEKKTEENDWREGRQDKHMENLCIILFLENNITILINSICFLRLFFKEL